MAWPYRGWENGGRITQDHSNIVNFVTLAESLAQPGWKQAIATEDFEFHISYL